MTAVCPVCVAHVDTRDQLGPCPDQCHAQRRTENPR